MQKKITTSCWQIKKAHRNLQSWAIIHCSVQYSLCALAGHSGHYWAPNSSDNQSLWLLLGNQQPHKTIFWFHSVFSVWMELLLHLRTYLRAGPNMVAYALCLNIFLSSVIFKYTSLFLCALHCNACANISYLYLLIWTEKLHIAHGQSAKWTACDVWLTSMLQFSVHTVELVCVSLRVKSGLRVFLYR